MCKLQIELLPSMNQWNESVECLFQQTVTEPHATRVGHSPYN